MKSVLSMLSLAFVLSGCSSKYATNGEHLYLQSQHGVNIKVPYPLSSANISHFYVLPLQTQNPRVSILPPDIKN